MLPDGSPSPLATISLTLDEETQFRCAGYIQAEIERYSDFLADQDGSAKSQEGEKSGDESGKENEDGEEEGGDGEGSKKKKTGPAKKARGDGTRF